MRCVTLSLGMTHSDPRYLAFWGKAQPCENATHSWHPVAYHLLDVAAAADALLAARTHALGVGARLLGMEVGAARRLVVALAALHDLGKFGWAFQAKVEARWPAEILGTYRPSVAGQAHTSDGLWLWEDVLAASVTARIGAPHAVLLHQLAPAVFGHHGRPVTRGRGPVVDGLGAPSVAAASECAGDLLTFLHSAGVDGTGVPRTRGDEPRAVG
ncbi:hypothetical protein tb265_08920 [Gemmatimonadetes bacterium T265]|nr:hypothetical protein tb265_08920 [Gemmatimonadetes bacterium T265]